jgi:hypothetical protein
MKAGQRCVPPGGRYLNHPTLIRDPGQTVSRAKVEALAARTSGTTVFLCGSVENEDDVGDLFDLVACLVVDEETLIGQGTRGCRWLVGETGAEGAKQHNTSLHKMIRLATVPRYQRDRWVWRGDSSPPEW